MVKIEFYEQVADEIEMVKQNCNTIVEIIYVFWGILPQTPVD